MKTDCIYGKKKDGEWISTIIDDQLYLKFTEYREANDIRVAVSGWLGEKTYTKTFLRGSNSLYFGKCEDSNETWLPLLEKAFAKAHGDYQSISGGWTGYDTFTC